MINRESLAQFGAEAAEDPALPVVEPPYLPPLPTALDKENTYTLVLDLDETLIHYFEVLFFDLKTANNRQRVRDTC